MQNLLFCRVVCQLVSVVLCMCPFQSCYGSIRCAVRVGAPEVCDVHATEYVHEELSTTKVS